MYLIELIGSTKKEFKVRQAEAEPIARAVVTITKLSRGGA
jgi:hypothetical protein